MVANNNTHDIHEQMMTSLIHNPEVIFLHELFPPGGVSLKSPKYTPTSHYSFKALVYLVVSVRRR